MTPTPEVRAKTRLEKYRADRGSLEAVNNLWFSLNEMLDALAASQERVRELEMKDEAWESTMREIANSGVSFEDERIGYVEVQISRDIWLDLAPLRGPGSPA